jgi:hypothetical protein
MYARDDIVLRALGRSRNSSSIPSRHKEYDWNEVFGNHFEYLFLQNK